MKQFSPREELLRVHRQIYRKNKNIIADSVIHEGKLFKQYEKRYLKAIRDYQSLSTVEEVEEAMMQSQIIYVGDYHTLNQSQRSFLRVLRSFVEKTKDFSICLEVIQARHQEYLDKYMRGKISDQTFLKKIGFREHWFFDLWKNFRPLFDFSRYHGIPLYGVEAAPETGASLKKRDAETAGLIFDIYKKDPSRKIFVFIGDLHLASPHLPRDVNRIFKKAKIPLKTATLYQNSESIYWKLTEKEIEEHAVIVKISKNEFCRMHTPPIIVQQSYLNWLQHEEGVFDFADAKQTFLGYLNQIADFLDIELGKEKDDVQVFTCGDLSFLKRLRETKSFTKKEIREIKRQILHSESYTIPKNKFVYLANVSVNHAAEEASHIIRYFCAGLERPRPMQDAFYANILHEALGFFGSKIINPKRKCLRPVDCRKLIDYLKTSQNVAERRLEYEVGKLFLEHEAKIKKKEIFHANKITSLSVDLFLGITHAIGYFLGEKMFYGLLQDKLSKDAIRQLYCNPMEEEGDAVRHYFEMVLKLKDVKLPKRV